MAAEPVREQDQVLGDIHGLAASNETGRRRLLEMLDEFNMTHLDDLADFIFDRTRKATMAALAPVPKGVYRNEMTVDGYEEPVDLVVELTVTDDGMHADFTGTSPLSQFGINVPIVYAQAYFTYAMLVARQCRIVHLPGARDCRPAQMVRHLSGQPAVEKFGPQGSELL